MKEGNRINVLNYRFSNMENYHSIVKQLKFKKKELSIITEYGTIKRYLFIVIENVKTGVYLPTGYSKFFFMGKEDGLLNKEINTKKNYAHIIVNFLNYVFIDKYLKYNTKNIQNITIDIGNNFLRDYARGKIGRNKHKSERVIRDAENKLTSFYRFLYDEIGLQNINKDDWKISSYKKTRRNGKVQKTRVKYKSLFTVEYPEYEETRRVKYISSYILGQFLKIADEYFPEITFGLALQAFAGLRAGEVCSIATYMITTFLSKQGVGWMEIDLRKERQLREDKQSTGQIKKHRIQPVHPVFMPVIDIIYNKHINLISKYRNEYSPLLINNRGIAMSKKSYYDRFNKIKEILIYRLSSHPNVHIRSQANILSSGELGTHVLRYYFTQFVAQLKSTYSATELAYWRGDSTLTASVIYLSSSPEIKTKLKLVQDEVMKDILG